VEEGPCFDVHGKEMEDSMKQLRQHRFNRVVFVFLPF
jgi:hypothetical protein